MMKTISGVSDISNSNLELEMNQLGDFSVEDFVLHEGADWFHTGTPALGPTPAPGTTPAPTASALAPASASSAAAHDADGSQDAAAPEPPTAGERTFSPTPPAGVGGHGGLGGLGATDGSGSGRSSRSALLGERQGVLSADGSLTVAPTPSMMDSLLASGGAASTGGSPIPPAPRPEGAAAVCPLCGHRRHRRRNR